MDLSQVIPAILEGGPLVIALAAAGAVIYALVLVLQGYQKVLETVRQVVESNEAQDKRQQKTHQHLMDTSIQLAQSQQSEFERRLELQHKEFERQLNIQKTDFEREMEAERKERETLATDLGARLLKKDEEIEGLNRKIATLNRDLQDAMKSLGTAQDLIKDLTTYKDTLEVRLANVIKERDELKEIVGELSDRLELVEEVQRKVDTDQLDPAKVEEEAKDKAA